MTMLAGALGAALLMSSGTFAQVPADPNNPNDAVPDAMAPTPYGEPITLENAKKAAAAAVAEMKKRNWQGMCIAVVGPPGDLVYFEKDDTCQFASIAISQHKARTAARYRRPTVVFERCSARAPSSPIRHLTTSLPHAAAIQLWSAARSSAPLERAAAPVRRTT